MQAGAATQIITNELGAWVQAAGVTRRAETIRDELEANALFLAGDSCQVLLVSCDVAALQTAFVRRARLAMAAACGIGERDIVITCTHTHGGPSLIHTNPRIPVDEVYMDRLESWLCRVASEAVEGQRPARIAWGEGRAQIGYNRRCCWADGTHSMHGSAEREGFTGLEGPDDPQQVALFVTDMSGAPIGVLHHNTTHPTNFYGAGVYSADFPGEARRLIREVCGEVPVLFMNGAEGDVSMERKPRRPGASEDREQRVMRIAHELAGETLRLFRAARFEDDLVLRHTFEDLEVGVRLPDKDRLEWASSTLARFLAGEEMPGLQGALAHGALELQKQFGADPRDTLPIHAIRLGGLGFVTQPCELFCQFGLDIKRRSPAETTVVVSQADGYGGYCPTVYGVLCGGYSGDPTSWTKLEMTAGYRIVDCASRLLWELWR